MRILVTGSSGWLGQTLVPRLSQEGYHFREKLEELERQFDLKGKPAGR